MASAAPTIPVAAASRRILRLQRRKTPTPPPPPPRPVLQNQDFDYYMHFLSRRLGPTPELPHRFSSSAQVKELVGLAKSSQHINALKTILLRWKGDGYKLEPGHQTAFLLKCAELQGSKSMLDILVDSNRYGLRLESPEDCYRLLPHISHYNQFQRFIELYEGVPAMQDWHHDLPTVACICLTCTGPKRIGVGTSMDQFLRLRTVHLTRLEELLLRQKELGVSTDLEPFLKKLCDLPLVAPEFAHRVAMIRALAMDMIKKGRKR